MEINVIDSEVMEASQTTFGAEYNEALIHQAVIHFQANARQYSKAQKNRSAVSGGGKKPWRQKGTGRARAGTSRSPLWRSGGVTFAAKPGGPQIKLNKKMYRGAMRSIFSQLLRDSQLCVVEDFTVSTPKTKELVGKLNSLSLNNVLIVSDNVDENLYLASRNIPLVEVSDVQGVNPVSLLGFEKVLMTKAAVKKVEELLG